MSARAPMSGRPPIVCGVPGALAALAALFVGAALGACGRIGIGGRGTPADAYQLGDWRADRTAQLFSNVTSLSNDWGAEISHDGLRLVFASNRDRQDSSYDHYIARRSSMEV